MGWLRRIYAKRIINVNVNIIVAGVLSMLLTLIPVHLSYRFTDNKNLIVGLTFLSDLVFDVLIYYVLHWLANHMPTKHRPKVDDDATRPSFFRDATLVQVQRAMLSPILYTTFLGLQYYLLHRGIAREWAAVVGLSSGILITRVLHTIWMLREAQSGRAGRIGATTPLATPAAAAKTERMEGAA